MTAILEPQKTQPVETAPEPAAPGTVAPVTAVVRTKRVWTLGPNGVRLFCVAMIGLVAIGFAVQPPADGANPVEPWRGVVLTVIVQFALLGVLSGVLSGRRWTVRAGLVAGSSLLLLSITCPIEGHHVLAAWWFAQMAVGIAMTVLPAVLLRRTQTNAG